LASHLDALCDGLAKLRVGIGAKFGKLADQRHIGAVSAEVFVMPWRGANIRAPISMPSSSTWVYSAGPAETDP
jgi:hypothetical protein